MKFLTSSSILVLFSVSLFFSSGCNPPEKKESAAKNDSNKPKSVTPDSKTRVNADKDSLTPSNSNDKNIANKEPTPTEKKEGVKKVAVKQPALDDTDSDDAEKLAAKELENLNTQFTTSVESLNNELAMLTTDEEKQILIREKSPEQEYTKDLFALVSRFPKTDAAFTAGMTIILQYQTSKEFPATMDLILDHHGGRIQWQKIAEGYLELVPSLQIENWMRKMIQTAATDEVKVQMTFLLYRYFDQFPTFASTIEYNPELKTRFSKEQIEYIFRRKKAVRDGMLADLKLIKEKHSDVKAQNNRLVKDVIDGPIFELEHLQVGSVAPDIEGKDFDGVDFKLSDYRGKVVMLDFWGNWCPPCRAMFPHERELIEQLVGKPFVLIGVNSDRKLETAIKATNQQNLVWRNFWCGPSGRSGPIAKKWNVSAWPTVYLIDAQGVIRYKEVLGAEIDRGIESLLAEMGHKVTIASVQKNGPRNELKNGSKLAVNNIGPLLTR